MRQPVLLSSACGGNTANLELCRCRQAKESTEICRRSTASNTTQLPIAVEDRAASEYELRRRIGDGLINELQPHRLHIHCSADRSKARTALQRHRAAHHGTRRIVTGPYVTTSCEHSRLNLPCGGIGACPANRKRAAHRRAAEGVALDDEREV